MGKRRLALGQGVVRYGLADGGSGMVGRSLTGVLTSGRLVFGLATGRLVAVLPAG